ncbi:MAG: DUF535 family protein [Chlorobiaceae bacterium]
MNSWLGNTKRKFIYLIDIAINLRQYLRVLRGYRNIKKEKIFWEFPMYFFSKDMGIKNTALIIAHHYGFIGNTLFDNSMNRELKYEISLWCCESVHSKIKLSSSLSMNEGMLELIFNYNSVDIYIYGITIAPGYLFGLSCQSVILISRMQAVSGDSTLLQKCTKEQIGINPQRNLFYACMGIAEKLNITHLVSVKASNQVSSVNRRLSVFTYDKFLETFGVNKCDNEYYYFELSMLQNNKSCNLTSHKRRHLIRHKFNTNIKQSIVINLDKVICGDRI